MNGTSDHCLATVRSGDLFISITDSVIRLQPQASPHSVWSSKGGGLGRRKRPDTFDISRIPPCSNCAQSPPTTIKEPPERIWAENEKMIAASIEKSEQRKRRSPSRRSWRRLFAVARGLEPLLWSWYLYKDTSWCFHKTNWCFWNFFETELVLS